jgi:integral membrane protein
VLKNTLGRLRLVGFAEGTSFLILLGIAMPLKYFAGMPNPVRVVGMSHGILWILYVAAIFQARVSLKWPTAKVFRGLAASVLPFGPFVFDAWLRRERVEDTV